MVYFSGNRANRNPAQRAGRFLIGLACVSLIIYALWQIPYDILREERLRLYGETRTTGLVTEVHTTAAEAGRTYSIRYKYIDQDGFARETSAFLPVDIWERYGPGSRIEVLYVNANPGFARVRGELEPAFQRWLRSMLD